MKQDFDQYYQKFFPDAAGYQDFLRNLTTQHEPVLCFQARAEGQLHALWEKHHLPWRTWPQYPWALLWPPTISLGTPLPGVAEHIIYPLNPASVLPVLALNPQPGDRVLDACAAPGGKALLIYNLLRGQGEFVVNDSSRARSQRLRQVLTDYGCVTAVVWQKPAATIFKHAPQSFDKILLDAPCSSENTFTPVQNIWRNGHRRGFVNLNNVKLR